MFYQEVLSKNLRFGDVVRGYLFTDLIMKEPILSYPSPGNAYKIDIEIPQYSVVLTPCCSIEKSTICITPLIKVLSSFFKNPYFAEDPTRINRRMQPHQIMSPSDFAKLNPERQEKIFNQRTQYTLLEYFIYKDHDIFDKYTLKDRQTSYYMIDFKNVQKIKCEKIKRPEQMSQENNLILESKILELTIEAREELREKIAYFYSNVPEEDLVLLD